MNAEQALLELYRASRLAPLTADQHDRLRQGAELVMARLKEPMAAPPPPPPDDPEAKE